MTTTTTVPAGLTYDPAADPQRRRHLLLGAPWGARVHPLHESGADRISRDDFTVDRALLASGLAVTVNHNPRRKVGRIADAATDETGLWLVVDLTDEGEELLAADGRVSIDVIQPKFRWILSGVAVLTRDQTAGIEGARAVFSADGQRQFWVEPTAVSEVSWLGTIARQADIDGGVVVRNGRKVPPPVPYNPAAVVDEGKVKAEMYAVSMQAVRDDTEYRRAQFERRQAQLAEMRREDVLQPLRAAMVPYSRFPEWSRERQSWDALVAQQEEAERAERAEREAQAHREALDELHAALRAREAATVVADEPKVRTSWLSRVRRWTTGR